VKVIRTPEALQDREDIWDHITTDKPRAAARMDRLFGNAAASLAEFPMRGRVSIAPHARELIVHESYRLVYEIADKTVWVLTLVDTSRHWPPTRE
jgi:toxin ParE1/3/4